MTDRLSRTARMPGWARNLLLPVIGPRSYRATYLPAPHASVSLRAGSGDLILPLMRGRTPDRGNQENVPGRWSSGQTNMPAR